MRPIFIKILVIISIIAVIILSALLALQRIEYEGMLVIKDQAIALQQQLIDYQSQQISNLREQINNPQYIEIIKEIKVPRTTLIVQRVEVPVIKIVEVCQPLKNFQSVEELKAWLDSLPYIVPSYPGWSCVDAARWLQEEAEKSGYRIDKELDYRGRFHRLNSVEIEDKLYFIEPQTHEYWLKNVILKEDD